MLRISLIYLLFCFTCSSAFAQNLFEKGNHNLELNVAVGAHGLTTQLLDSSSAIGAGNVSFPIIAYEYGLLKEVGIGLEFQLNKYSSDSIPNQLTSKSVLITNNLHFIRKEKFDFLVGVGYGLANYKASNSNPKYKSDGAGFAFELYTGTRFKLNEQFSLNTRFIIDSQSFRMKHYEQNGASYTIAKNSDYYTYLNGFNLLFGITYKLKY